MLSMFYNYQNSLYTPEALRRKFLGFFFIYMIFYLYSFSDTVSPIEVELDTVSIEKVAEKVRRYHIQTIKSMIK